MRTRFGILDQLRDNWPRQFEQSRIQLLERKTRAFTNDDLVAAVDHVLETCSYPPTVKDMIEGCKKAQRIRLIRERKTARENLGPGDVDPWTGERYLLPHEALEQLKALWKSNPEAFSDTPVPPVNPADEEASKKRFKLMATRIFVGGLMACVRRDPDLKLPAGMAVQKEMF